MATGNELTLVVHKERFQDLTKQLQIESGTDDTGGSILLESGVAMGRALVRRP